MTPLIFLLLMFAGFGIFGFWAERSASVERRRAELRRTLEAMLVERRYAGEYPRAERPRE